MPTKKVSSATVAAPVIPKRLRRIDEASRQCDATRRSTRDSKEIEAVTVSVCDKFEAQVAAPVIPKRLRREPMQDHSSTVSDVAAPVIPKRLRRNWPVSLYA